MRTVGPGPKRAPATATRPQPWPQPGPQQQPLRENADGSYAPPQRFLSWSLQDRLAWVLCKYILSEGSEGRKARNLRPRVRAALLFGSIRTNGDRFLQMAEASGDETGYQTLINSAPREHL